MLLMSGVFQNELIFNIREDVFPEHMVVIY